MGEHYQGVLSAKQLEENGVWDHLRSDQLLKDFLSHIGMSEEEYERGLNDPATQARIQGINERYRAAEEAAGNLYEADPVFVINGRHLIVGKRFGTIEQAFRTANAIIREELEASR